MHSTEHSVEEIWLVTLFALLPRHRATTRTPGKHPMHLPSTRRSCSSTVLVAIPASRPAQCLLPASRSMPSPCRLLSCTRFRSIRLYRLQPRARSCQRRTHTTRLQWHQALRIFTALPRRPLNWLSPILMAAHCESQQCPRVAGSGIGFSSRIDIQ